MSRDLDTAEAYSKDPLVVRKGSLRGISDMLNRVQSLHLFICLDDLRLERERPFWPRVISNGRRSFLCVVFLVFIPHSEFIIGTCSCSSFMVPAIR